MAPGRNGTMLRDVRRQPAVLAGLLARAFEFRTFAREHLVPDPGGALHATGCGDGWFASRAVESLIGGGPHPYRPRAALPFLVYDAPAIGPADRVLVISMSGNVDRSVEAAEAALARDAPVALLTNGDGGAGGGARGPAGFARNRGGRALPVRHDDLYRDRARPCPRPRPRRDRRGREAGRRRGRGVPRCGRAGRAPACPGVSRQCASSRAGSTSRPPTTGPPSSSS